MSGKNVKIELAGGVASADATILPEDTLDQVIITAAKEFGLPQNGTYHLLGPDNKPIMEQNIFKVVKENDVLTLAPIGQGG